MFQGPTTLDKLYSSYFGEEEKKKEKNKEEKAGKEEWGEEKGEEGAGEEERGRRGCMHTISIHTQQWL